VKLFLEDKVSFLGMSDLIADCMSKVSFIAKPTLEDYILTDEATRALAHSNKTFVSKILN
jgi:1-deoxy-D-xylulose-5-phosphate reductoisomerase